jgi:hypothetical protein
MNTAEKAFSELFPERESSRALHIKYSRAFKPYNANVQYNPVQMTFRLSRHWKEVSEDIRIGLIQSLLVKVYKEKKKTLNMDLYDNFMRNIGDYAKADKSDPVLEESFDRVNAKYFDGFLDRPNLIWGEKSFSKLGSYAYGGNTITISKVLEDDQELLDYVMYHEMLHKKHKYHTKNGRSFHHTTRFRKDERSFENPGIEERLTSFLRKKRVAERFRPARASKRAGGRRGGLLSWFFD